LSPAALFHFGTEGQADMPERPGARTASGMKQRTVQTLYGYWNALRAGRIAPRRLEIEPSRIGSILSETFMLERTDPATCRYRLAGTRLCEIFGFELRGTNLLDGWSEADRRTLAHHMTATCGQGAVTLIEFEAGADSTRRVQLEAILLPLVHDGTSIDRVIGAMSAMSSPNWLGHERLRERRLIRHEMIWPDGRPHAVIERAGRQAPFHPAPAQARIVKDERRSFRVLDGGRKDD
jgi:hypothetical protein